MTSIIVKFTKSVSTDRSILNYGSLSSDPEELAHTTVETANLSPADRKALEDSPQHLVADEMQLELIKSVATPQGEILASTNSDNSIAWGIEAVEAHSSSFNGQGVSVAVLDTGIDASHPAFAGVNIVERNFTAQPDGDQDGHGTHCAGTIFGRDVDGKRIGVAPGVTQAFIAKVIPAGTAALVNALNWAFAQNAHVASMSLGIDFPGFVKRQVEQRGLDIRAATSIALTQYRANLAVIDAQLAMFKAQELGSNTGMVVVAATGNESKRPNYTIAAAPPSAGINVVSVGALSKQQNGFGIANFSNTNPIVAAPGVDILSARAGVGDLITMSGTSMACPHVAGIAALYWHEALMGLSGQANASMVAARVAVNTKQIGISRQDVGNGLAISPQ